VVITFVIDFSFRHSFGALELSCLVVCELFSSLSCQ
jgi:hypothetical protein